MGRFRSIAVRLCQRLGAPIARTATDPAPQERPVQRQRRHAKRDTIDDRQRAEGCRERHEFRPLPCEQRGQQIRPADRDVEPFPLTGGAGDREGGDRAGGQVDVALLAQGVAVGEAENAAAEGRAEPQVGARQVAAALGDRDRQPRRTQRDRADGGGFERFEAIARGGLHGGLWGGAVEEFRF